MRKVLRRSVHATRNFDAPANTRWHDATARTIDNTVVTTHFLSRTYPFTGDGEDGHQPDLTLLLIVLVAGLTEVGRTGGRYVPG